MTAEQKAAVYWLECAERDFLLKFGWTCNGVCWVPPSHWPFKRNDYRTRSHAVNAQKQLLYNPQYGGEQSERPG